MRLTKAILIPLALIMTSCLGVKADIVFNSDNSGTITVEYRISSSLESLGKQDGNAIYPPLPVGRTDMERTVARLPGMKLNSWVSRDDGKDKVITARLQFPNPQTLALFLDASGGKAVYTGGSKNRITLLMGEGGRNQNDFDELVRQVFSGYSFAISMSFHNTGELVLTGGDGVPAGTVPATGTVTNGKKVLFAMPMENLLYSRSGVKAEFIW